jgi:hypothetical protein
MLKKVFLASTVSLLLAGVTLTAAPSESLASKPLLEGGQGQIRPQIAEAPFL